MPLIEQTDRGLYCAAGGFHIDPWEPVERAVITHAHSDHARPGHAHYLAAARGEGLLRARVGSESRIETLDFGEMKPIGDARVSFHPAGHLLGSAQVRVEHRGEVWVVSGDYKLARDSTCTPFDPVPCDVFISECTFGLPIYHWPPEEEVFDDLHAWWRENQEENRTSVIFAYALGKAQRVLAGLDDAQGPVLLHGAVSRLVDLYRDAGIAFPEAHYADEERSKDARGRGLIIAPPSAARSPWLRRFGDISTAFVSGWMQIRGARRRRSVDRGFILSDHADWDDLLHAIDATGAKRIGLTHGYVDPMARYLRERGLDTLIYRTRFEGEQDSPDVETREDHERTTEEGDVD